MGAFEENGNLPGLQTAKFSEAAMALGVQRREASKVNAALKQTTYP
jgi:hypothetical protein